MQVIRTVHEMQRWADARRAEGKRVGLVPTMGALHAGHLALVREVRQQCDAVVISIFVNPTQFVPGEDFERYPRTLDTDLVALEQNGGVEAVFAPPVDEMYRMPGGINLTWVTVDLLGDHLCGPFRPGHFRGVTTVVARLFNACKPNVAVFGLKDAQQYVIIKRMVADLLFDVEVIGVPTVREQDGLALSSRNVYLSAAERVQAVVLSRAVSAARRNILEGEQQAQAIVKTMLYELEQAPNGRVQYAEVVDAGTLQPVEQIDPGQEILAAVAVYLGSTRLIDNAFVEAPRS